MSDKREGKINELVNCELDQMLVVDMIDLVGLMFYDDLQELDDNAIDELHRTMLIETNQRVH